MVSIVVVDLRPVEGALVLHPASRAVKRGHTPCHRLAGDAQHPGSGGRAQGIHGIVPAHDAHIHMAVNFTVHRHVEMPPIRGNILCPNLILLSQAEADMLDALHGLHRMRIVPVGGDAEGSHFRELVEGFLNVG